MLRSRGAIEKQHTKTSKMDLAVVPSFKCLSSSVEKLVSLLLIVYASGKLLLWASPRLCPNEIYKQDCGTIQDTLKAFTERKKHEVRHSYTCRSGDAYRACISRAVVNGRVDVLQRGR